MAYDASSVQDLLVAFHFEARLWGPDVGDEQPTVDEARPALEYGLSADNLIYGHPQREFPFVLESRDLEATFAQITTILTYGEELLANVYTYRSIGKSVVQLLSITLTDQGRRLPSLNPKLGSQSWGSPEDSFQAHEHLAEWHFQLFKVLSPQLERLKTLYSFQVQLVRAH
eukprot:gene18024-21465_t